MSDSVSESVSQSVSQSVRQTDTAGNSEQGTTGRQVENRQAGREL